MQISGEIWKRTGKRSRGRLRESVPTAIGRKRPFFSAWDQGGVTDAIMWTPVGAKSRHQPSRTRASKGTQSLVAKIPQPFSTCGLQFHYRISEIQNGTVEAGCVARLAQFLYDVHRVARSPRQLATEPVLRASSLSTRRGTRACRANT